MQEEYKNLNPIEDLIDKDEEKRIFIELSKIDGIHEYLKALMNRDMRLHFQSKKEDQDMVRGAFYRTEYLLKKVNNALLDKK